MRILHVIPSFYPATAWGGPMFSVYGLCNALAREADITLAVATTDAAGRRLSARLPVSAQSVPYPAGYTVRFFRRRLLHAVAPGLLAALPRLVREADVVHLTAVYSFPAIPTLVCCRLLGKPLVWSPRGAFLRWPHDRRRLDKAVWDRLCRWLALRERTIIHVTSDEEARASARHFPGFDIVVIPNGVEIPPARPRCPRQEGKRLHLLFMGRLHPIKGIENLLAAMALSTETELTLCGTGEPEYERQLRVEAKRLGLEGRVRFAGMVEGEVKEAAFAAADICVLPSHSENFGMAVAEALARGLPVIASNQTPWSALESHGCGLWVANDPPSLAAAIAKLERSDLAPMAARGRNWMRTSFSSQEVARRMAELYERLI